MVRSRVVLGFVSGLAALFHQCALVAAGKDGNVVAHVQNPWAGHGKTPENPEAGEPETLPVYDDEDAASAAQRICEEHRDYDSKGMLEMAKHYKEALSEVEGYSPPKATILLTGGKYMRRAEEAIKEKRFAAAAADCLRALMRPGLDPTATEPMMKRLEHALWRMEGLKTMADQDAKLDEEKYAVQKAEADALTKEWRGILAQDNELWRAIDDTSIAPEKPAAAPEAEGKEVAYVSLNVNSEEGKEAGQSVRASVREGEDASHAAFHFCAANKIHDTDQLSQISGFLQEDMKKNNYEAPKHLAVQSAGEHMKMGQSHQENFEFSHAGIQYARGLQAPGITEEEKEALTTGLAETLSNYKTSLLFRPAWVAKDYQGVIDALKELPAAARPDSVQLILARAYFHQGKTKEALASLTSLLNKCDKSGDWLMSEPRSIASISGAILALQVGDIEKAKKMYQMVLRNDPEQAHVKSRYKVLRSFMKILNDIKELTAQSKNHDVIKAVDRTQQVLVGVLGEDGAKHAGTPLLLFECKAKSAMTFFDDALEACNTAIKQFENHDNPDPRRIAEAYAWRAEANMKDNSFDDAVADLTVATTKNPNNQEYQQQLRNAKEQQDHWNHSEEQHTRRGEKLGVFYSNRPIKQMLDLPDNVDELDKEAKCKYLKTNFRKMSLRWHPDKAKGGKARAQRKSSELSEGKGLLEAQWGCKGRR